MISNEQAANALAYLEALAAEGLAALLKRVDAETARYNIDMQKGAITTLRAYINNETEVKVVYEYKLQRADGKYLNTSYWDNKGKTYKSRGALASAIAYHIEGDLNRANVSYQVRREKEFRAQYIPEDWTVIAIPVNTKANHKHVNAREWYLNAKPSN